MKGGGSELGKRSFKEMPPIIKTTIIIQLHNMLQFPVIEYNVSRRDIAPMLLLPLTQTWTSQTNSSRRVGADKSKELFVVLRGDVKKVAVFLKLSL